MRITSLREPANALTHLAGACASMVGLTLLVIQAALKAGVWHIVSFAVFGTTLVLLYTASTLYHSLNLSSRGIARLRKLDHMMIFLLIAGTYTPICLVPLRGAWGWSLFGTVWGLAAAGIVLKVFFMQVPRWVSTSIYLFMGWMCVVAVYPLVVTLPAGCLFWLALGGLFYSAGAVIYALKWPNPWPNSFGFHGIWHGFVMAGSFCHFWAVYRYLPYV